MDAGEIFAQSFERFETETAEQPSRPTEYRFEHEVSNSGGYMLLQTKPVGDVGSCACCGVMAYESSFPSTRVGPLQPLVVLAIGRSHRDWSAQNICPECARLLRDMLTDLLAVWAVDRQGETPASRCVECSAPCAQGERLCTRCYVDNKLGPTEDRTRRTVC